MELFNGEIVSYSLSESPNFNQVSDMLSKAFRGLGKHVGLILHSDQGWQYQMRKYHAMLKKQGVRQNMSRKGDCLDNALIENFFGTLKSELFYLRQYVNISELPQIEQYIRYYNNDRIRLNLKGMSPVKYRAHHCN